MVSLKPGQLEAVEKLQNGSILFGTVGSGKSLTSLVYYVRQCGGVEFESTPFTKPMDLFIITPAAKRDKHEWDKELTWLLIGMQSNVKVMVDSWNNIEKYKAVKNAFFIFDEQHISGSGAWVKSFQKIAKSNRFILLTATPGDVWTDYIPIFIANGFYENRASFILEHVVYHQYLSFPKIVRYNNEEKLRYYRDKILVTMEQSGPAKPKYEYLMIDGYDRNSYNHMILDQRWDPWEDAPIKNASKMAYLLRRASNISAVRLDNLRSVLDKHKKVIVFYNFDYEMEYIKLMMPFATIAEYNGHRHELIPKTDSWLFLAQYAAISEAWNCIETDTIVFWSLNYSYRMMIQASGRIDRMDSPYTALHYYKFVSNSPIDAAIASALHNKKNFNESAFLKKHGI